MDTPSLDVFIVAVAKLMSMVEPGAKPFQIVVQVGDSSRGFQLAEDRSDDEIAHELWKGYQSLTNVNG